jgi:hypothetical protein
LLSLQPGGQVSGLLLFLHAVEAEAYLLRMFHPDSNKDGHRDFKNISAAI